MSRVFCPGWGAARPSTNGALLLGHVVHIDVVSGHDQDVDCATPLIDGRLDLVGCAVDSVDVVGSAGRRFRRGSDIDVNQCRSACCR